MRSLWTSLALLGFVVLATPAVAADGCLRGTAVGQDTADIALLRQRLGSACPCAAFTGASVATDHAAYKQCVRVVVNDAADGTPIVGLFGLRPQCRAQMNRIHSRSDCGFLPADDKNPCCRHSLTTGRNRGAVRRSASCTDSPGRYLQNDCVGQHFTADACSDDATNTCTPGCGDGVVQAGEQCDGGADAACPGLCGTDCACPQVMQSTVTIPSSATPPNTPGTAGVVVSEPKLITQFGASFSLNNATYTRFAMNRPVQTPEAIVILVPGFEGGADDFKILAENLIPRALADHGLVLEVWGYDRRTHQLEDRAGLDVAESLLVHPGAPQIGLDWLFGGELGLTLHPALVAGPNRRAVFYGANANEIPFLANWTNLVFSRDIDAVVAAADAAVLNHNVFLGGHSAGTGFAARYAATDFDLTGLGPAQPGYAKLRGLVLLEGGGGSTGGTPPSSDTLDRIEAKFDGGLHGAVKANAPRCVDGTTPCTIATETTDCASFATTKCTLPTTEFALALFGLLNPRILAAVEPAAMQGALDPDGGQIILQVDQGAPMNDAVNMVADLNILGILPEATVEGGIGSFVDDDGAIAGAASFVATSIGSVGPVVGGLTTWLDLADGPLPADLPDNGPAPTVLPAPVWGQEQEVTRFDRLLTTFYAGGSNFTDWYYPNAGPSTTTGGGVCIAGFCTAGNVGASCTSDAQCSQAINLDSSALSIGRGRRDIENLTQAANLDIPVIGFGGTNGLARVPGSFVAFATSMAPCASPSCTGGTPRVVDATLPNPAFPTLGDVAGGFEVHISEGYAHVDVLTAEDGPGNEVIGPLAAFLARNVQ